MGWGQVGDLSQVAVVRRWGGAAAQRQALHGLSTAGGSLVTALRLCFLLLVVGPHAVARPRPVRKFGRAFRPSIMSAH